MKLKSVVSSPAATTAAALLLLAPLARADYPVTGMQVTGTVIHTVVIPHSHTVIEDGETVYVEDKSTTETRTEDANKFLTVSGDHYTISATGSSGDDNVVASCRISVTVQDSFFLQLTSAPTGTLSCQQAASESAMGDHCVVDPEWEGFMSILPTINGNTVVLSGGYQGAEDYENFGNGYWLFTLPAIKLGAQGIHDPTDPAALATYTTASVSWLEVPTLPANQGGQPD